MRPGGSPDTSRPLPLPTPSPCPDPFRTGLVTDVGPLQPGTVNFELWKSLQNLATADGCVKVELAHPQRPDLYQASIEKLIGSGNQLLIGSSFLVGDEIVNEAERHPSLNFAIVEPFTLPKHLPNLFSITIRYDQAGFLAGALAGLMTKTNAIGEVYGLEGGADSAYREGFERGVRLVNPKARLLSAFQPPDAGMPYDNPSWGAQTAREWINKGADIVFASGGNTAHGALEAIAASKLSCIATGLDSYATDPSIRGCLLSTALTRFDVAMRLLTGTARWGGLPKSGTITLDAADDGISLAPFHDFDSQVSPALRSRLAAIFAGLANRSLSP